MARGRTGNTRVAKKDAKVCLRLGQGFGHQRGDQRALVVAKVDFEKFCNLRDCQAAGRPILQAPNVHQSAVCWPTHEERRANMSGKPKESHGYQ